MHLECGNELTFEVSFGYPTVVTARREATRQSASWRIATLTLAMTELLTGRAEVGPQRHLCIGKSRSEPFPHMNPEPREQP